MAGEYHRLLFPDALPFTKQVLHALLFNLPNPASDLEADDTVFFFGYGKVGKVIRLVLQIRKWAWRDGTPFPESKPSWGISTVI